MLRFRKSLKLVLFVVAMVSFGAFDVHAQGRPNDEVKSECDFINVSLSNGKTVCREPGSGKPFQDCPTCPKMVVVPAGKFLMGSNGVYTFERPRHRVTIPRPFAVGQFEITFAQWNECVSDGGCTTPKNREGALSPRHPVIYISWAQTKKYVRWLSQKTKKRYRLLTEAEWEYASRAGTTTKYSFGNQISCSQARYLSCSPRVRSDDPNSAAISTAPVGSFPANAWGVHDVHGNVAEFVEDAWNASHKQAPVDGSARLSGTAIYMGDNRPSVMQRVVRGGGWVDYRDNVTSAYRRGWFPDIADNRTGLRVARELLVQGRLPQPKAVPEIINKSSNQPKKWNAFVVAWWRVGTPYRLAVGLSTNHGSKKAAIRTARERCVKAGGGGKCRLMKAWSMGCHYLLAGRRRGSTAFWMGTDKPRLADLCQRAGYNCKQPVGGCIQ